MSKTIKTPFGEFVLGAIKDPVDERDYLINEVRKKDYAYPELLDLRNKLRPIRNQGSQGTCAAQTAACMKEYQELKDIDLREYLSPQFVYNCREDRSSEGMYGRNVMDILKKIGIVREEKYPYYCHDDIPAELYQEAQNLVIKAYARITTIEDLKQAVTDNGPCYISVPCYDWYERMWIPPSEHSELMGGHAMTVVGYNAFGFLIRNSWGESWGQNGYCIFPYEDWGHQWDVWTTCDSPSEQIVDPEPEPDPNPRPKPDPSRLWGPFDYIWYAIRWIFTLGKTKK